MTPIKQITAPLDYKKVTSRIDEIILLNPTKLYHELNVLGTLAASYEELHFPIDSSN